MLKQLSCSGMFLCLVMWAALAHAWEPLPGALEVPSQLQEQLKTALSAKLSDPAYTVRSEHILDDGKPRFSNRLLLSRSPYLLQHAHNPVDWRPWSEETFALAKQLNRPILLSIGYSTCHWCHVMEQESFEDLEIARFINEHYIAIMVDREERPDIDSLYMKAALMLNGQGGWPLTVWLLPDGTPFYATTYLPPRDGERGIGMGFLSYLTVISSNYSGKPEQIQQFASQLTTLLQQNTAPKSTEQLPTVAVLGQAAATFRQRFDPFYGGLEGAPKFPSGLPIRFILRYYRRSQDAEFLRMAELTLEQMAAGGLRDQLGGGFHRYTVDPGWREPHFEQMLYDNALLAVAYLEGYQASGREDLAATARAVLDYMNRVLGAPEGGFYTAIDADSRTPSGELEEGYYFTWTLDELSTVLDAEQLKLAQAFYGVKQHGELDGRNILHRAASLEELAQRFELDQAIIAERLQDIGQRLLDVRGERPAPHRDEKILTAWNGLAIAAFAFGGWVLKEPAYIERAERAAGFVLDKLYQKGRLLRSFSAGQAQHNAYLQDYAYLIDGLLHLLEARAQPRWLNAAIELQTVLDTHYADPQGGYFATSDDHETLLVREKPHIDNDLPSGNSIALLNLLRLSELTLDDQYRARADQLLKAFGEQLENQPESLGDMLVGLDYRLSGGKEIVIAAANREQAEVLLDPLRQRFYPNRVMIVMEEQGALTEQAEQWPLLTSKRRLDGKTTAYVCEGGSCQLPTTEPEVFLRQLGLGE